MAKHGNDKQAAKVAAKLIKAGKIEEARRVIAAMSPAERQKITDRIIKGLQIAQGKN